MHAFARLAAQFQPLAFPVLMHAQSLARLDTTQHRDQALGLLELRGKRQGGFLLADLAVVQIPVDARLFRWLFDGIAQRHRQVFGVRLVEVLEQDLLLRQKTPGAFHIAQLPLAAAKPPAIEADQNTKDISAKAL
jgi:hypothetical protein